MMTTGNMIAILALMVYAYYLGRKDGVSITKDQFRQVMWHAARSLSPTSYNELVTYLRKATKK